MLSRRQFIGAAGGVAGATAAGGGIWAALIRDSVETSLPSAGSTSTSEAAVTTTTAGAAPALAVPYRERILVVLEMAGGNDALNTLVPAVGAYRDNRRTLGIAESELVTLSGTDYRLHPALAPIAPMWENGSLAAVAGVGMTGQSRSHFKAMDTWWAGVPGPPSLTGWLGRWLDATLEGDNDPLRAIALGGGSRALVGEVSLATVVRNPGNFQLRTFQGTDAESLIAAFAATSQPLAATPELAAAQAAIPSTIDAVELLASVSGADDELFRPGAPVGGNTATELLQTAAGIIDLAIGTRVLTVGISGFDTHADQLSRHQALLADVGEGLASFFAKLEADGNADKVMVLTNSEFGRRVAENASGGTDHGNGGLQFLIGSGVSGRQVVGELDLVGLDRGDLASSIDTRSVYASALTWLGGPVDEILGGAQENLGLLGG